MISDQIHQDGECIIGCYRDFYGPSTCAHCSCDDFSARELELQDRHSRLENQLRDLMNIEGELLY